MKMQAKFGSFSILAALLCCVYGVAQKGAAPAKEQAAADAHKLPAEKGESIDRIVAVVNGDIVLESDLDEELRFVKLQPYRITSGETPREQALSRLIDRRLILQQQEGVAQAPVTDAEVDEEISDLRKDLPMCERYACTTDAGWKRFLTDQGFTEKELRDHYRLRIQVLHFIEQRFRSGIRISDAQIEEFYTKTMLPQYAKEKATPPPLEAVSDRIEQVLLQQQVSVLLDQWLKALRDQGSVRLLKQGEEVP
jgi:hypothetical protein